MNNRKLTNGISINNAALDLKAYISFGILDSALTGISFYLGFVIYKSLASELPIIGKMELLLLSLGMAFSYAFIYVYRKSYNSIKKTSYKDTLVDLIKNLTLSYLLDLTMLFVMKDNSFMAFRIALGIGLIISIPFLFAGRLASGAIMNESRGREGKRRLILTGLSNEKRPAITEIEAQRTDQSLLEQRKSDGAFQDSDNLLGAIDILQDGKNRVIIHKASESKAYNREATSANR